MQTTNNTTKSPLAPQRGGGALGRTKTRVLSAGQFATIRPFLRISEARIDAARQAMVEGMKFEDISKEKGWKSKQAVDRAVASVWGTWKKYEESQAMAALYNEPRSK